MLLVGADEHSNYYNFQPNINSLIHTGSYCKNHRAVPSLWQGILFFISKRNKILSLQTFRSEQNGLSKLNLRQHTEFHHSGKSIKLFWKHLVSLVFMSVQQFLTADLVMYHAVNIPSLT